MTKRCAWRSVSYNSKQCFRFPWHTFDLSGSENCTCWESPILTNMNAALMPQACSQIPTSCSGSKVPATAHLHEFAKQIHLYALSLSLVSVSVRQRYIDVLDTQKPFAWGVLPLTQEDSCSSLDFHFLFVLLFAGWSSFGLSFLVVSAEAVFGIFQVTVWSKATG